MPVTFAVSPVVADSSPLPSMAPLDALRRRGIEGVEACSSAEAAPSRLVDTGDGFHPLISAVHVAFAQHRPLALSPDHVWLCVAQAVARHVDARAEQLRGELVAHQGRRTLEVRRDDFRRGDPSNDWPAAIATLADALDEILGPRGRALFAARLSTTDDATATAGAIVMMGAVQQFFDYRVSTLCGIPQVTLEGTPEDWASLRGRVELLEGLGLAWWLPSLRAFLQQCARAAAGDVEEAFWRQLYKAEDASGGLHVSGWINALFPYLGDLGADEGDRNSLATAPIVEHELEGCLLGQYPSGLTQAPFTWQHFREALDMSLVGGFVGVEQDARGVVRPRIGWAVTPRLRRQRFRASDRTADGHPVLRPRAPVGPDVLRHLAAEAPNAPFVLSLGWQDAITSLTGLEGLTQLAALDVFALTGLRDLEPLRGLPGLRRVLIQQCGALVDIGALASLPSLTSLQLAHLPALVDLRPIAACRGLERLALFGRDLPPSWVGVHEGETLREVLRRIASA
ncbi:MAG: DUF4419 domain-containing protein [Myxococcales bacterium]|nr:DUF4419 domain-containing protein [Myxococcales bacterium]